MECMFFGYMSIGYVEQTINAYLNEAELLTFGEIKYNESEMTNILYVILTILFIIIIIILFFYYLN